MLRLPHLLFAHRQVPERDSFPTSELAMPRIANAFKALDFDLPGDGPEQEKQHVAVSPRETAAAAAAAAACRVPSVQAESRLAGSRLVFVLFCSLFHSTKAYFKHSVLKKIKNKIKIRSISNP